MNAPQPRIAVGAKLAQAGGQVNSGRLTVLWNLSDTKSAVENWSYSKF
jgi:hypothetical protein